MSGIRNYLKNVSFVMAILLTLGTVWSSAATAAMVSTGTMISEQQVQVDRQQLLSMLDKQQVQDKLADMGVSEDQVRDRINSLTPQELSDFQQQLAEAPAGEGVVGIIVLFLVIFIVTDMLCATDIFPFVNCIR
jgi:uncharacterized protein YjiS (DUF1127 family)